MNVKPIIGIYGIHNKTTKKWYIGQSDDIRGRLKDHLNNLNANNSKESELLQEDWNKYGQHDFKFKIIQKIDDDKLLDTMEKIYIHAFRSFADEEDGGGYNLTEGGKDGRQARY